MSARPEALAAVTEAVRLVEDAIDATSADASFDGLRVAVPTDRTGLAVVEALVEAGWAPPGPATPDPARTALREVLSTFTDHGHTGRPVVRTTWQYPEHVAQWRAALDEPGP